MRPPFGAQSHVVPCLACAGGWWVRLTARGPMRPPLPLLRLGPPRGGRCCVLFGTSTPRRPACGTKPHESPFILDFILLGFLSPCVSGRLASPLCGSSCP